MGQARAAVTYGIILDKKLQKEVDAKLKEPEFGEWKEGIGKDEPNSTCGMTDRFNVLGFVVAIDGYGPDRPGAREGIPDLPIGDLSLAEKLIGKKYVDTGRKKWESFATWAKSLGVELPEPTLIITEVETA